ncbi:hypothetical protein GCM10009624_24900 [Gordonia sinesedis]
MRVGGVPSAAPDPVACRSVSGTSAVNRMADRPPTCVSPAATSGTVRRVVTSKNCRPDPETPNGRR